MTDRALVTRASLFAHVGERRREDEREGGGSDGGHPYPQQHPKQHGPDPAPVAEAVVVVHVEEIDTGAYDDHGRLAHIDDQSVPHRHLDATA